MAKKTVFSSIALLLVAVVCLALFAACGGGDIIPEFEATTDNYRTYYQIFPYAFADSNGDGIGDIRGIINKLDYIAEMNFEGIWLTPVHESPSYHKYDVTDYYSIDPQFGTLDDYDELVEECHKRGMTILLDLVINHSSNTNDWFTQCVAANERRQPYDEFYDFYNIETDKGGVNAWYEAGKQGNQTLYYEGQFWSGMPDFNWDDVLQNPETSKLGAAFEDVMRFWLIDHDVDGFRLDAVSQFFTGDALKNVECLRWIDKTAKSIKPDCYIVGEGPWDASAYSYYNSGADSFFLFNHAGGAGSISIAGRSPYPGAFSTFAGIDRSDKVNLGNIEGSIPALFVVNHDTGRALGMLQGNVSVDNMKMGYAAMVFSCGTAFWYYGDEVGMSTFVSQSGDMPDENIRQPMPWADAYRCRPAPGTTGDVEDSVKYPWGTVEDNLEQENSLIEFITRANALRRAFPAIARNYGEVIFDDDDAVGIVKKGDGADAVYVAANFSHMANAEIDLSQFGEFQLVGTLSVDKTPSLGGEKLSLPYMSFAVLRKV